MSRGRPRIRPRRRIFFGCEGESEQGYGALLQDLANKRQNPLIALDLQVLGGGDPLAIVETACQRAQTQSSNHGEFAVRAVLLDADRRTILPAERNARIAPLAAANGLLLIWAAPCYEAFLLRHLPGCQALRPMTSADALCDLRQRWPAYSKPMPRTRLALRVGDAEIQAAAAVEPALDEFLRAINFF
jgi:hypothetical protein